ncbi:aminoacyl-histidine dipeptidase [Sphingobacterium spiritivorum]|uniref:Cytosol non-specific dipeptidase n=1 Tax=Sphingobacterium spiritivorum ATCC 33861 TaxID=525373 RepID=D7VSJ4_SPHSI|nr:aminoacyl-histidine dipeptidase [Sphingobacterium spiritivorum]EFK56745.1 Xaa-His dipeptidase [Sphingobacterium spiritivorum ATCC 33861]QQT35220.1 aminoacyl-histidine dipeptidase [Sphingobacterium spiritivorum]WQD36131.1 aminoacyl-histidine dipeptidase [Sphingobacterium spiritivorum]SUJ03830.1 Cytosol non-specific dipeptidase [Sphingobacterium spiritivorum]
MNQEILQLQPQSIWKNFNALNAVPRASKKEERVIAFIQDFGKSLGLETITDKTGNVVIRKPATAGMEDRKGIVLQSHLDMVHQKNNDTVFDFDADGIRMLIDGDWVKADGTTLGADNGIGVATIMAILESKELAHPAIDALFTIDEETGMTGAFGLEGGVLQGEILLNLDTEDDTEIDIGCAGGVDVTATKSYSSEPVLNGYAGLTITVKGLNGGHSGMEIHKGLGNANKIMNRVLFGTHAGFGLRLSEIKGGGLRNAIPRESVAKVVLPQEQVQHFISAADIVIQAIKAEYKSVDAGLEIVIDQQEHTPVTILPLDVQEQLIKAVYAAHNGVYRMSADFADLVETSNNIANIEVKDGKITIKCLTRSSVESSKYDLANALKSTFELMGAEVGFSGDYPGWTPDANSQILQVLKDIYEKQYHEKPEVVACHAGLECGILGRNYPGMDMISFGPTILGAHSPAERVSISSVQKFWAFIQEILVNIPKK